MLLIFEKNFGISPEMSIVALLILCDQSGKYINFNDRHRFINFIFTK